MKGLLLNLFILILTGNFGSCENQKLDSFRLFFQGVQSRFSFGPSTNLGDQVLLYDPRSGSGEGFFDGTYGDKGSLVISPQRMSFAPLPYNQPNVRRELNLRVLSDVKGAIDFSSGELLLHLSMSFDYPDGRKKTVKDMIMNTEECYVDNHDNELCPRRYGNDGKAVLVSRFQFDNQEDDWNYLILDVYLSFPEYSLSDDDCPSLSLPFNDFFDGEISMVLLEKLTYWYDLNPGSNNEGYLHFDKRNKGRVPLSIPRENTFFAPIHVMAGVIDVSHVYFPETSIVKIQISALRDVEGFVDICTGQVSYLYDTAFKIYIGRVDPYPDLSVICDLNSAGGVWRNETFDGVSLDYWGNTRMIATAMVPQTGSPIMDGLLQLPNEAIANLVFHLHLSNYGWEHLRRCFC